MSNCQQVSVNHKLFNYDLDPNLIYNFNDAVIEYIYKDQQDDHELKDTITLDQLNSLDAPKINKIQHVLCCRFRKTPYLVIFGSSDDNANYLSSYNVRTSSLKPIKFINPVVGEITHTDITCSTFKVAYLSRLNLYETRPSFAMVIGTKDNDATLILLTIDEEIDGMRVEKTESFKTTTYSDKKDIGHVTAICILAADKLDKRMGHSDPQILLGFSKGSILTYRIRASIFYYKASRIRTPVDLSEFVEFPGYPISQLSCARAYNSLLMNVAMAQEKPADNPKYQYSRSYIKVVELHGNFTRRQRAIINPPDNMESPRILETKLIPSTTTLANDIVQLSIIFQDGKKNFDLNVWEVSPVKIKKALNLAMDQQKCVDTMAQLNTVKSLKLDNDGYLLHAPQKIADIILQENKDDTSNQSSTAASSVNNDQTGVDETIARDSDTEEDLTNDDTSQTENMSVDEDVEPADGTSIDDITAGDTLDDRSDHSSLPRKREGSQEANSPNKKTRLDEDIASEKSDTLSEREALDQNQDAIMDDTSSMPEPTQSDSVVDTVAQYVQLEQQIDTEAQVSVEGFNVQLTESTHKTIEYNVNNGNNSPDSATEVTLLESEEVTEHSNELNKVEELPQPSEEPSQPSEEPSQPSEEPSQSSEEPSQSSEEPSQPNNELPQTSEEPSQPSEEPSQPSEEPSQLSEEPSQPNKEPQATHETIPTEANEIQPEDDRLSVEEHEAPIEEIEQAHAENVHTPKDHLDDSMKLEEKDNEHDSRESSDEHEKPVPSNVVDLVQDANDEESKMEDLVDLDLEDYVAVELDDVEADTTEANSTKSKSPSLEHTVVDHSDAEEKEAMRVSSINNKSPSPEYNPSDHSNIAVDTAEISDANEAPEINDAESKSPSPEHILDGGSDIDARNSLPENIIDDHSSADIGVVEIGSVGSKSPIPCDMSDGDDDHDAEEDTAETRDVKKKSPSPHSIVDDDISFEVEVEDKVSHAENTTITPNNILHDHNDAKSKSPSPDYMMDGYTDTNDMDDDALDNQDNFEALYRAIEIEHGKAADSANDTSTQEPISRTATEEDEPIASEESYLKENSDTEEDRDNEQGPVLDTGIMAKDSIKFVAEGAPVFSEPNEHSDRRKSNGMIMDYIPVSNDDLLRLLSDEHTPIDKSKLNAPESIPEPTPMAVEVIEEPKDTREPVVLDMLQQCLGKDDADLDTLTKDEKQKLGDFCWTNKDPKLIMFMLQLCDRHEMATETMLLYQCLQDEIVGRHLSEQEWAECKAIARKWTSKVDPFLNYGSEYVQHINPFSETYKQQLHEALAEYDRQMSKKTRQWYKTEEGQKYLDYYSFGQ